MRYAQDVGISAIQIAMCRIEGSIEGESSGAVSSSDSKASSIVNQSSDPHKIKEDCRVDWLWFRRVVVAMRQRLEDFGRKVQPWSMVGRYVAPVPVSESTRGLDHICTAPAVRHAVLHVLVATYHQGRRLELRWRRYRCRYRCRARFCRLDTRYFTVIGLSAGFSLCRSRL